MGTQSYLESISTDLDFASLPPSLAIPDCSITPAQYADMHRGHADTPEKALWLAVFEDAIGCLTTQAPHPNTVTGVHKKAAALRSLICRTEAERWFRDLSTTGPG